jgi:hypothetical protein
LKKLAIGISGVTGAQVRQAGGKREADLHSVIFDPHILRGQQPPATNESGRAAL